MDCATGCTRRDHHTPTCDDPNTCTGCEPRPAAPDATICTHCRDNAHAALTRIPDLIRHIRSMTAPGSRGPDAGNKPTKADSAPAPMNLTALDDADELHALICDLAVHIADDLHLTGPTWAGTLIRPASKRRTTWGDTVYDPPRVTGLRDATAAATVITWVLPHYPWLTAQPWAADELTVIRTTERALTQRWPTTEPPRRLPAPCPACDRRATLTRYAPSFPQLPVTIACTAPDCGHVIPEEQYGLYARVLADETKRTG